MNNIIADAAQTADGAHQHDQGDVQNGTSERLVPTNLAHFEINTSSVGGGGVINLATNIDELSDDDDDDGDRLDKVGHEIILFIFLSSFLSGKIYQNSILHIGSVVTHRHITNTTVAW